MADRAWWQDMLLTAGPARIAVVVVAAMFAWIFYALSSDWERALVFLSASPFFAVALSVGLVLFVIGLLVAALIIRGDEKDRSALEKSEARAAELMFRAENHNQELISTLRNRINQLETQLLEMQRALIELKREYRNSKRGDL